MSKPGQQADPTATEIRIPIAGGENVLYVRGNGEWGWSVWLNHRHDFDGVRIGNGATRGQALIAASAAVHELLQKITELEG